MNTSINLTVNEKTLDILKKRAKIQHITVEQLCEEILRHSAQSWKNQGSADNLEDPFIGFFSRKNNRSPKKSKPKIQESFYTSQFKSSN